MEKKTLGCYHDTYLKIDVLLLPDVFEAFRDTCLKNYKLDPAHFYIAPAEFNYCLLIWMLHSRQNNNKIKHLHERCLRLIHNDKLSSYEELLEKDESVSIHHKNIQSLAIEMFQIKHGQSPEIVSDIFTHKNTESQF